MLNIFDDEFPDVKEGVFVKDELFSLEISISEEPVRSIHLCMHFGKGYTEKTTANFENSLSKIYRSIGGIAFSVSDSSRIV